MSSDLNIIDLTSDLRLYYCTYKQWLPVLWLVTEYKDNYGNNEETGILLLYNPPKKYKHLAY